MWRESLGMSVWRSRAADAEMRPLDDRRSKSGRPRMTKTMLALLAALAILFIVLRGWRAADERADHAAWQYLVSRQPANPATFDNSMIIGLPEAAQRYFRFSIVPGAPLRTVAEISMQGEFSLGSGEDPDYMPMYAEQVLAAPYGFLWKVRAGDRVWFTGSDGATDESSWSRFWLLGVVPIARAGNNPDHRRSAFGRYVAEAIFWTPAALLPGNGVRWEAIDESSARAVLTHDDLEQAVDVTVDAEGRPLKVAFQRWSNANPEKKFQSQPFGGYLSDYREFDGFRLPTRVEAGNFFETDDYFAFFKASVTDIRFP
jgi:hypothetical protein